MTNRILWSKTTAWLGMGSCLALGTAAACGGSSAEEPKSAEPVDAGPFDGGPTGSDARADTSSADAGADVAVHDAGTDSGTDSGTDAATDGGGVFASCKAGLQANPAATSGFYAIDPDGAGAEAPRPVFCDMTTDGGGWTLGLLRNSVDTGTYPTFGSGYVNMAALGTDPKVASATAVGTPPLAGWIDLNVFPYTELVLEGFIAGASTFRSAILAKSTLRIPFGQSGYYLYDDANGYYWCGGAAAYTDNGVGQVNTPSGAPADCKGHSSLGDGWDFGSSSANTNLTACGGGSALMKSGPAASFVSYPSPGAAHAFWVR